MRCLTQEIGASRGSTDKALPASDFYAYHAKMVQEIKPPDLRSGFVICSGSLFTTILTIWAKHFFPMRYGFI